jgi:hypothetical protein
LRSDLLTKNTNEGAEAIHLSKATSCILSTRHNI